MFGWGTKNDLEESVESQLARLTGLDEHLIAAVGFQAERLQDIFQRASKNDKIGLTGKVVLGFGAAVLGLGLAKSGTLPLLGGAFMTVASAVPIAFAKLKQSGIVGEIKQAGLDRLVRDYKIREGIPETIDFQRGAAGRASGMTLT